MTEMNKLISEKLKKYPADIQKLIKEAYQLADRLGNPKHVAEELKGLIRTIIKD